MPEDVGYESDITAGRPDDPVSTKTAIGEQMNKGGIPVPNNINKISVEEAQEALEQGRIRKELDMEDRDMYSGGHVKEYRHGGSVRKTKLSDY